MEERKKKFVQGESSISEAGSSGLFAPNSMAIAFTGKPLTALANTRTIGVRDSLSKTALSVEDITIYAENGASSLGVGEHKILMAGVSAFTEKNGTRDKKPDLRVSFDFMNYAKACGVEVEAKTMSTPEEQAEEDERALTAIKHFQQKLRENCKNLMHTSINWTERINRKEAAYNGMVFISAYRITSKTITLEFSLSAADYMVQLPQTTRPIALYGIDDRKYNAYSIGCYLSAHYAMNQNVMAGTENLLRVENILKKTKLPTKEEMVQSKSHRTWIGRAKEPFEEALDELKRCGLLSDWYYSHSKGIPLSDEEASAIDSYEEWSQLLLCFEVANFRPRAERRALIEAKKEKTKAKKEETKASTKSRKRKTKSKASEA